MKTYLVYKTALLNGVAQVLLGYAATVILLISVGIKKWLASTRPSLMQSPGETMVVAVLLCIDLYIISGLFD